LNSLRSRKSSED
jgi:hypothetical protein